MSQLTSGRLLTVKQVAERLNLSERTVWRLIRDRLLKVKRFGRTVRISESDLNDFTDRG
jgi:excisionase family DNA binding protein